MNPQLRTSSSPSAFKITGGIYTLTTLELHCTDSTLLTRQLENLARKAPCFFDQTPTLVALDTLKEIGTPVDIPSLRSLLKQYGMILIAVRGGSERHKENALKAGIAWLPAPRQVNKSSAESKDRGNNIVLMNQAGNTSVQPAGTELSEPPASETRVIDQPVRSGQQIYSSGDLVTTCAVSAGAELLAGGNIHVYGPLRGRALAGVNGNDQARIFCRQFEAELISINGQYKIPNDANAFKQLWGKPVRIALEQKSLHIRPL
ncbi:MAG: septum site-determining protein MinC [Endozoicomonas sp.]